jgi:hypothetical protein
MTSNEMGATLGLSAHTVDWYMNGIQEKLHAKNRHHVVAIAFRLGSDFLRLHRYLHCSKTGAIGLMAGNEYVPTYDCVLGSLSVPISKILVANRSEIAIRVFRAANELDLQDRCDLGGRGQACAAPVQG